jgi:hypothetical protein
MSKIKILKTLIIITLSFCLFFTFSFLSGCAKAVGEFEWFQTENILPITQLQTKQSQELEDNHIAIFFNDLWNLQPEAFPDNILDASHILNQGVKRARFAINSLGIDEGVHWTKPENTIDPSHDNFITSLAENGITLTYILSFWDKEYVAQGGKISVPRFKTEEEIQRYLDFVQFIVHHFKDRIQYYEIWNEPELTDPAGDYTIQSIEVEDYINLVERAVPVIKEEYPEAKIVVGGTGYLLFSDSHDYLFSILRSDVMPLVDVIEWHPMYGTSPEYDEEYYYNYPSLVQEIKDVASAHGFKGEYEGNELSWVISEAPLPGQPSYSETICAKYYARGIVMHLGMDVTTSQFYYVPNSGQPVRIVHTIQNLCTIMAGNKPINISIKIESEATNIRSYSFSLSNGDKLIALWTDGVAVDNDTGVNADLTIQGIISEDVTGIDALNGYQQSLTTSNENGNLIIQDLIVRDYPVIFHIKKSSTQN